MRFSITFIWISGFGSRRSNMARKNRKHEQILNNYVLLDFGQQSWISSKKNKACSNFLKFFTTVNFSHFLAEKISGLEQDFASVKHCWWSESCLGNGRPGCQSVPCRDSRGYSPQGQCPPPLVSEGPVGKRAGAGTPAVAQLLPHFPTFLNKDVKKNQGGSMSIKNK